ncbi:MAG: hypothetical protein JW838_01410 [Spirochaetes bacterium]|nr:hypothetical protein [Spirochaetota bacterium]
MFKVPPMKASDFTCLLCGSRLKLKLEALIVGDNRGHCPMCGEPFLVNLTKGEMEDLKNAERSAR